MATLLNGGSLDPKARVETVSDTVRCLPIGEDHEIDDRALEVWARQAAALPGDELL